MIAGTTKRKIRTAIKTKGQMALKIRHASPQQRRVSSKYGHRAQGLRDRGQGRKDKDPGRKVAIITTGIKNSARTGIIKTARMATGAATMAIQVETTEAVSNEAGFKFPLP